MADGEDDGERRLLDELGARGPLPPDEAWTIARAVLDALAAAHVGGFVHRAVRPAAVLVTRGAEGPSARLRGLPPDGEPASEPAPNASSAPEVWMGGPVDGRTDLYGVGATLFQMLVGAPPFAAGSPAALREAVLQQPPPSPRAGGATIGAAIDVFVRRLLAKNPADRFPNAWAARSAGDHAFGRDRGDLAAGPDLELDLPPAAPEALAIELDTSSIAGAPPRRPPSPMQAAAPRPAAPAPTERQFRSWAPLDEDSHMRRALTVHAVVATVGATGVVLLGWAGPAPRDVVGWARDGGWAVIAVVAAFLAVIVLLPRIGERRATRRGDVRAAFALASVPVVVGAVATWVAWTALRNGVAPLTPEEAFVALRRALPAAGLPRFVGFATGTIAFLLVAALPTRRFREQRFPPWRLADLAAASLVGAALLGLVAGAHAGTFVALVAAAATLLGRGLSRIPTPRRKAEVLEHVAASVAATFLATGAAFARLDARAGAGFAADASARAERLSTILAATMEREGSRWIAGYAIAVVVAVAALRLVRMRARVDRLRVPRRPAVTLAAIATFLLLDAVQLGLLDARRGAVDAAVAPALAVFARLEPPPAVGEPIALEPPTAPVTLQLTSVDVAVDGRPLARIAALDTAPGRDAVVRDLARAMGAASGNPGRADLAVAADRRLHWSRVRALLRLARQAGAGRVEVLLARGDALPSAVDLPPEATAILPGDLVALPIAIEVAGADPWEDEDPFEEVAGAWQAAHAEGTTNVVGVGW